MKIKKSLTVLAITLCGLCLFSVACQTTTPKGDVAKSPASTCVPRPANAPEGSNFVCHLECSGKSVEEFAETHDEGIKKVKTHVRETCRIEDGQYFAFCSCLE